MDITDAATYAEKHELHALVVQHGARILSEIYANGHKTDSPHALYSGTKSFWGIAALEAQREGILSLEDIVTDTVTVRMLLQLTAGYGFGGLGSAVPTYQRAIAMPLKTVPGETFTYSGIPLQVFGGYFAQRLSPLGLTPHEYLRERILTPAGVSIASWRTLIDGTNPLPTGAFLTADNWLKYGRYVMERHEQYAEAFVGSRANARYGLGWWLGSPTAPADLFYASGSAGQALYVVPSQRLTVVHFGKSSSYKHEAFLKKLFGSPR
jgi:CubicO group peptidase (beta-lactamase class C family)